MAIGPVTVQKALEIDALLQIVVDLVVKAKAGETAAQITVEELQPFLNALMSIGQVPAELAASKQVVAETVGAKLGTLTAAFL